MYGDDWMQLLPNWRAGKPLSNCHAYGLCYLQLWSSRWDQRGKLRFCQLKHRYLRTQFQWVSSPLPKHAWCLKGFPSWFLWPNIVKSISGSSCKLLTRRAFTKPQKIPNTEAPRMSPWAAWALKNVCDCSDALWPASWIVSGILNYRRSSRYLI